MRIYRNNFSVDLNDVGLIEKHPSKMFGHVLYFYHKIPVVIDQEIGTTGKYKKVATNPLMCSFDYKTEEELDKAYADIMNMLESIAI